MSDGQKNRAITALISHLNTNSVQMKYPENPYPFTLYFVLQTAEAYTDVVGKESFSPKDPRKSLSSAQQPRIHGAILAFPISNL